MVAIRSLSTEYVPLCIEFLTLLEREFPKIPRIIEAEAQPPGPSEALYYALKNWGNVYFMCESADHANYGLGIHMGGRAAIKQQMASELGNVCSRMRLHPKCVMFTNYVNLTIRGELTPKSSRAEFVLCEYREQLKMARIIIDPKTGSIEVTGKISGRRDDSFASSLHATNINKVFMNMHIFKTLVRPTISESGSFIAAPIEIPGPVYSALRGHEHMLVNS